MFFPLNGIGPISRQTHSLVTDWDKRTHLGISYSFLQSLHLSSGSLKVGCAGDGFVIIFGLADFFGFDELSFGILPLQRQGENVKGRFQFWLKSASGRVTGSKNTFGYGPKSIRK